MRGTYNGVKGKVGMCVGMSLTSKGQVEHWGGGGGSRLPRCRAGNDCSGGES